MPSPTNKAQDNSIRENVYRVIRENITSLQLAPGTTVSTQELAAKLQVRSMRETIVPFCGVISTRSSFCRRMNASRTGVRLTFSFAAGFKLGRGGIHKPALQPPARADGAERRHL